MEKNYRTLLIGAFTLFSANVMASPIQSYDTQVLHTGQYARPITDFINTEGKYILEQQVLDDQEIRTMLDGVMAAAQGKDVERQVLANMFPVEPERIKQVVLPGTRILREFPALPRPMFVIGNDNFSLKWLQTNKQELIRFQAAGMLTKVKDKEEYEAIKKLAAPLSLMPVSADALAAEMGAPGYPIMITGRGFFQ